MRWLLICTALSMFCLACGGSKPKTPKATGTTEAVKPVNGKYALAGSITAPKCAGGYNIVEAGVTVKNEAGTVIGSTTTGENVAPAPTPVPAEDMAARAAYDKAQKDATADLDTWINGLSAVARSDARTRQRQGTLILDGTAFATPTPLPRTVTDHEAAYRAALAAASDVCLTRFTASLPKATFYQVQVGSHGGRPYSFDELQKDGFHLDLTLQ